MMRVYESRSVLAGAYRGRGRKGRCSNLDGRELRSHWYDVTDGVWAAKRTLCGKLGADSLCDVAEAKPATCPECVRRFSLRHARGEASGVGFERKP